MEQLTSSDLEGLLDEACYDEVYVLVDADEAGNKLRRISSSVSQFQAFIYKKNV
jgi:toprim domain protein